MGTITRSVGNMKWIGITGTMGSGKSTVSQIIREHHGYSVLDADKISRDITAPGTPGEMAIVHEFGNAVLTGGIVDRKKLGALVFADTDKLRRLEMIIHPRIRRTVATMKANLRAKLAFYDVPLLYEMNLEKDFDGVLVVTAPLAISIERIQARSGLPVDQIHARLAKQLPTEEKMQRADWVISNDGSLGILKDRVSLFLLEVASNAK